MSLLANAWSLHGNDVTLITFDRDKSPVYPLLPRIKLQPLGLQQLSNNCLQGAARNLRRVKVLRRSIRDSQPDIIISFLDTINILTLIATRGLGKPVVISERTNPAGWMIGPLWNSLRRFTYRFADELVCQTEAALAEFSKLAPVKMRVIPNPVVVPKRFMGAKLWHENTSKSRFVVAMGRLGPEKGLDLLLNAFASIANRHDDWSLKILGQGPLRDQLQAQARDCKLEDRVHFLGEVPDPFPILCAADLFVLSSRYEGFPNALCEAMACGLPVVSFNCTFGPADIIRHGVDGILVPPRDVPALATAMDRLMANPAEAKRLATQAPEIATRFNIEIILSLWQCLFDTLV